MRYFLSCILLCLSATGGASGHAQWEHPGSFPFQGGPQLAEDKLLDKKSSLSSKEFWTAVARHKAGEAVYCREDYFLQDDLVVKTTFTVPGEKGPLHKAKWLTVAFKDETGKSLPENHADRRAVLCQSGNKDGYNVMWPAACGQPTIGQVSFLLSKTVESKPVGQEWVCRLESSGQVIPSSQNLYLPSVNLPSSCCCDNFTVPSLSVSSDSTIQTDNDLEIKCNWE